jgi:hypothetical protein
MNYSIVYVNGIKMSLELASKYHRARSKIMLGLPVNKFERNLYLLYATKEEVKEYLKNEKK